MNRLLTKESLKELFGRQLTSWEQARDNYKALERVESREVMVNGFPYRIQFNPARIISSAAKVDTKSITERKCFLCAENRPLVQEGIPFVAESDPATEYIVLINPFPIFPRHLTIPANQHTPQLIMGRMGAMLELAKVLDDYTIFYNGPKCGASAPDHFHFQAGNKGFMPIEKELSMCKKSIIAEEEDISVYSLTEKIPGVFGIESSDAVKASDAFEKLYAQLPVTAGEEEPMLNILVSFGEGQWTILVFVRIKHRPSHYFAEGEANILLSPASVDMGGVLITPLEKDYIKIGADQIGEIIGEVLLSSENTERLTQKLKNIFSL